MIFFKVPCIWPFNFFFKKLLSALNINTQDYNDKSSLESRQSQDLTMLEGGLAPDGSQRSERPPLPCRDPGQHKGWPGGKKSWERWVGVDR